MDAQQIRTEPDPFEPFYISQAFRIGDLVVTSGERCEAAPTILSLHRER